MMAKTGLRRYIGVFLLLAAIVAALGYFIYTRAASNLPAPSSYADKGTVVSLNTGWDCAAGGKSWQNLSLPVKLPVSEGRTCVMSLRLPSELPRDAALCFRGTDQTVSVTLDGAEIYRYDTVAEGPFGKATVSAWNFVLIGAGAGGKVVEISLTSPYAYSSGLLPEVRLGSNGALLAQTTEDHIWEYTVSCALFVFGLLLALFALHLRLVGYRHFHFFTLSLFVMIASVYLRVESHVPEIFILDSFSENWISYVTLMLMPLAYILHARIGSRPSYRRLYTALFWAILATDGLRLALQLTGRLDFQETQFVTVLLILALVAVGAGEWISKYFRDRPPYYFLNMIGLVVLVLSIIAELTAHVFYLYRGAVHGATIFSWGLLIYVLCVIFAAVMVWLTDSQRTATLDRQLAQQRFALLTAEMQPHFLSNSLLAIEELCYSDPDGAADAIVKFSAYLRGNLDFLSGEESIPFAKEFEHICNFMEIERIRFGPALKFETDVGFDDFTVPVLSIEPLVENAVDHGIRKRHGSGTVALSVREENGMVVITVRDDGVGFDPATARMRSLANLDQRLLEAGASLTISSTLGVGTEAVITIGGNHAVHDR